MLCPYCKHPMERSYGLKYHICCAIDDHEQRIKKLEEALKERGEKNEHITL